MLEAALDKEIQRAERFDHPFSLILIDVDHLSDINARHGYGVGDRVLERIGILMRNYFREQDWVARFVRRRVRRAAARDAARARRRCSPSASRTMVAGALTLHDYRSEEQCR